MATKDDRRAIRKFKFERVVGRVVMNPVMGALARIGVHVPLTIELETIGRKSGEPRRVPLNGRGGGRELWVISQHGRRAGWAYNVGQSAGTGPHEGRMAQRHGHIRTRR